MVKDTIFTLLELQTHLQKGKCNKNKYNQQVS